TPLESQAGSAGARHQLPLTAVQNSRRRSAFQPFGPTQTRGDRRSAAGGYQLINFPPLVSLEPGHRAGFFCAKAPHFARLAGIVEAGIDEVASEVLVRNGAPTGDDRRVRSSARFAEVGHKQPIQSGRDSLCYNSV